MAQVVIRNIDEAVLRRLRARARRNGIPLERLLRKMITAAARDDCEEFRRRIDAIRRRIGNRRQTMDSTRLIREARNGRRC